jgi:hypothetical protein
MGKINPAQAQVSAGFDTVMVVDKTYLEKRFHAPTYSGAIDRICLQFKLNAEQQRAFKIVANHIVLPSSGQLKMYIGGMGGTGKSQVLKAIAAFFTSRNEAYRFTVVAPTGSAAALLGGSTYHSVLGINDKGGIASAKILSQVRARLSGADYMFLDEVSMLAAYDLYKISAQLSTVMNQHGTAFGGINMIFAGDFGQLPPPMGGENVSLYSRVIGKTATSMRAQEEAIGRALWHQVTTVVILRNNMRQQTNSTEDNKFRTALANMRYRDCTSEDLSFLKSRISSFKTGKTSICDVRFNNVAIITAKNVQKDEINRLGCIKFAAQTNQKLTDFYSEDTAKWTAETPNKPQKRRSAVKKITNISTSLQNVLWGLPHSAADKHIAGTLSLCFGLPVMIKTNVATELCITNGQEAVVAGWQSCLGSRGQLMLDVLFVELTNPPTEIQLDGLPKNTVPLTCSTNTITCSLPDDSKIQISRSQVEVLPSFAMTDFASQGKTRPQNPVDLSHCRSHQAYYTALSRSASADGTVILQGFDCGKITGKASGALRQEFRDLELLDEITSLQYESKLHKSVLGDRRNCLLHAYRAHKGLNYVPLAVHDSIKWSVTDPMLAPINDELEWKLIKRHKEKDPGQNHLSGTQLLVMLPSSSKRRLDHDKNSVNKMLKFDNCGIGMAGTVAHTPLGLLWYQNSCAYDASLTIMHAIWSADAQHWSDVFTQINGNLLGALGQDFGRHMNGLLTLDAARDNLRRRLLQLSPTLFGWGELTSIQNVLEYMLMTSRATVVSCLECPSFHPSGLTAQTTNQSCLISAGTSSYSSINHWMANFKETTHHKCMTCRLDMIMMFRFSQPLHLLAFDFAGTCPSIDTQFQTMVAETSVTYQLRGVLYYGANHFTCRIVSKNGTTWFHDGIATGKSVVHEGHINNLHSLSTCQGKQASAAIYTLLAD